MKRLPIILIFLFALTLQACGQDDKVFAERVTFMKGFDFVKGGTPQTLPFTGTSSGVADWNTLLNKPSLFPPTAHNHDLLYKPIGYVPSWSEITGKPSLFSGSYNDLTNKPAEIQLINAIPGLDYLPLPQKTTAEINAFVMPSGVIAEVWDKTLGVKKVWNGTIWKTYITGQ